MGYVEFKILSLETQRDVMSKLNDESEQLCVVRVAVVWSASCAVDGVEFVFGKGVLHVVVVSEGEHLARLFEQFESLRLRERSVLSLIRIPESGSEVSGTLQTEKHDNQKNLRSISSHHSQLSSIIKSLIICAL